VLFKTQARFSLNYHFSPKERASGVMQPSALLCFCHFSGLEFWIGLTAEIIHTTRSERVEERKHGLLEKGKLFRSFRSIYVVEANDFSKAD
jgi:hypothetical protein